MDKAITLDDFVRDGDYYVYDGYFRIKQVTYEQQLQQDAENEKIRAELVLRDLKTPHVTPTIEELQRNHLVRKREFEAGDAWKSLKAYLKAEQEKGLKITKIVGLGLGSCQNEYCDDVWIESFQNEAVLLSVLKNFLDIETCICQDPVFGPIDKAFLELLGFEVVDDPAAFEVIDEETFAWFCGSDQCVEEAVATGVHPAAMICSDLAKDHGVWVFANDVDTQEDMDEKMIENMRAVLQEEAETCVKPRKMVENYSPWCWSCPVLHSVDLVVYTKNRSIN